MNQGNNLVAIVGRPNVGKSALFNRLVGRPIAIVADRPGVTRDRHTGQVEWGACRFWVVDTGGFDPASDESFGGKGRLQAPRGRKGSLDARPIEAFPSSRGQGEKEYSTDQSLKKLMHQQVQLAIEEAGQIVFLVDGRAGLHPTDRLVAELLRRSNKPVWLAVNKIDRPQDEDLIWEFSELGFEETVAISSLHGLGVDTLLDLLCKNLPKAAEPEEETKDEALRIAVVGRPNVGKSSIVNRLLGKEASVVYDVPGTTRDSLDTPFRYKNNSYVLVDTAGLRQKGKITDEIEQYSSVRAIRAIEECDVAVMVIDAKEGITEQDERIAGLILEAGRGCVIAVNKWDLVEKDNQTFNAYIEAIRAKLNFLDYAPIVFVSALTRQRLNNLMDLVAHVGEQHAMRISTGVLNRTLEEILTESPPPTRHGKPLKIFYLSQTGVKPPAFALFVNEPKLLHFSYMRHLKNSMRGKFGFEGSPLFIMLRKRK